MSTPPVLANAMETCTKYKPECIGHVQKLLFYIALPLIAFGMSGHLTCWKSFIIDQIIPLEDDESESDDEDDNDGILLVFFFGMVSGIISEMSGHLISWNTLREEEQLENIPPEELQEAFNETTSWRFHIIIPSFVVGTIVAVIALFYIKPWSLRFGIPAICTLVATLLFISGSWSYKIYYKTREISPLTVFLRVFVAAISKLFYRSPKDATKLYEIQDPQLDSVPHTNSLRCLDKAAIVIPTEPLEEQEKNKWRLCRVTEVEETKTIICMIPVWMTFILCGVVSAIGFTFFIEQLNHLNPKVGRLKVPIVALLYCHEQAQNKFAKFYAKFAASLGQSGSRKLAPSIGIAVSMVLGINSFFFGRTTLLHHAAPAGRIVIHLALKIAYKISIAIQIAKSIWEPLSFLYAMDFNSPSINAKVEARKLEFSTLFYYPIALIEVQVCQGLIFFSELLPHVVIWNPATHRHRQVPVVDNGHQFCFGYDCITDDYKLVIYYPGCKKGTIIQVYSLVSDTWGPKRNYDFKDISSPIYVDGVLYQMDCDDSLVELDVKIVVFDLATNVRRVLPGPIKDRGNLKKMNLQKLLIREFYATYWCYDIEKETSELFDTDDDFQVLDSCIYFESLVRV
ncbi:hypothetical protein RD792_013974 [Penstemon davidsonii]|uniref:F-box associated beta-propeller type 1 domain-containing protein n=1 Tax=Penstemon davidsonii TaxID=160366 RepID=A0ABR0CN20_9LAMI|nr:hypothetical protein RD792_013974 [Penstemon davidsonii]